MKNVGVLIVLGVLFVSVFRMNGQQADLRNLPFPIDFQQISNYLELEDFQKHEIYQINDYFLDQQRTYLAGPSSLIAKKKSYKRVLFGNLKLMKKALSPDQYRKYVALINVTHNNRMTASYAMPDVYLALQPEAVSEEI